MTFHELQRMRNSTPENSVYKKLYTSNNLRRYEHSNAEITDCYSYEKKLDNYFWKHKKPHIIKIRLPHVIQLLLINYEISNY